MWSSDFNQGKDETTDSNPNHPREYREPNTILCDSDGNSDDTEEADTQENNAKALKLVKLIETEMAKIMTI